MIKIKTRITFLFIILNLIQLASGNTFIICNENGYSQELELITPHDSHEHHNETENKEFHINENDCNSCDDFYVENSVNISSKPISDLFFSIIHSNLIEDLCQAPLKNSFIYNETHLNRIISTLYFPSFTVILV